MAGGYVGDGVSTTNLAGRTIRDLILRRDTDLIALPWVGHRSRPWEPEPLRSSGSTPGSGWPEGRPGRGQDRRTSWRSRSWTGSSEAETDGGRRAAGPGTAAAVRRALPKANTPPSNENNQYPPVAGSTAMPPTGALSSCPEADPWNAAEPLGVHRAVVGHLPVTLAGGSAGDGHDRAAQR